MWTLLPPASHLAGWAQCSYPRPGPSSRGPVPQASGSLKGGPWPLELQPPSPPPMAPWSASKAEIDVTQVKTSRALQNLKREPKVCILGPSLPWAFPWTLALSAGPQAGVAVTSPCIPFPQAVLPGRIQRPWPFLGLTPLLNPVGLRATPSPAGTQVLDCSWVLAVQDRWLAPPWWWGSPSVGPPFQLSLCPAWHIQSQGLVREEWVLFCLGWPSCHLPSDPTEGLSYSVTDPWAKPVQV